MRRFELCYCCSHVEAKQGQSKAKELVNQRSTVTKSKIYKSDFQHIKTHYCDPSWITVGTERQSQICAKRSQKSVKSSICRSFFVFESHLEAIKKPNDAIVTLPICYPFSPKKKW